jgi:tetratricopeptide (TPR) repeat protein
VNEAIEHFEKSLELDPESVEVHGNLVRALAQAGRLSDAAGILTEILRLHPDSAAVHNTLGVALVWQKRTDEAIAYFNKALELDPRLIEAHQNLGDALSSMGRDPQALKHWLAVLDAAPNHLPALNQAARVMATDPDPSVRNGSEAVRLAERAVQLSAGREPAVLEILAAAYAESKRFPEAIETARRAIVLANDQGSPRLVETLNSAIALYQASNPVRRP